ncbi:MAG: DUF255 domain-containing protein [Bacteroidetes bacterium]|nr:DUF255 domain-containing protein [Bacteroidota bacterium]
MKKIHFLLITLLFSFSLSFAQVLKPVKWTFNSVKTSDSTAILYLKATMNKGWHVYSQNIKGDGPVPTSFSFIDNKKDYKLIGNVFEPKGIEEYDPNFEMKLKFFSNTATFSQQIKILSDKPNTIKGTLSFMCCDDKQCLPPEDVDFSFKVEGNSKSKTISKEDSISEMASIDSIKSSKKDSTNTSQIQNSDNSSFEGKGLWGLLLFAISMGFAAIITPCVFPMVPMTVSFFLKGSKNKIKAKRNAIFYGISIIAIYTVPIVLLIVISTFLGKGTVTSDIFNWMSTHWLPNIIFFIVFMIFAASFLGMFEIVLPSSLVNKVDSKADKGGFWSPFFMALVLVLISFSCTGPIVGWVVVESSTGGSNILRPIIAILGFSVAFALPFTLFAFFPSLMHKLPKSGGWLNTVKVVLGFLELALGFKFLSVADQVYHWGILDRDIYLAIWIVIFTLLGFYLLGKLKFFHDSDIKHISVPRLTLAIITFTFVVYMIPGMFGAPLKALSGYIPPQATHDFDLNAIIRENANTGSNTTINELCDKPKYSDILHLPHGLKGFFDYNQALACAKQKNKPIFIDFTGHGCVNCREMEANVWSDPKVLKILREKYIVVALYVDDKTTLPKSEWITSKYDGKVKQSIGKKFADFQVTRFNMNAQPYYVLLDTNDSLLAKPKAYDLNVDNFVNFLESGFKEFEKRHKGAL